MGYQPKSNRKFYASALTTAMVASAVAPAVVSADSNFDDVHQDDYYYEAVNYLANEGVLEGPGDGSFYPNDNIERNAAAQTLMKAQGLDADGSEDFPDVDPDDWFYEAVVSTSPEIFEGDADGEFKPFDNLSRQEAAAILVRAYDLEGGDDHPFTDVDTWANDVIAVAYHNGIIKGEGNNQFAPKDNVTRAEFATMVYRAELGPVKEVSSLEDITVMEGGEVTLPETVEVTYSNDHTANVPVEWNTVDLDTDTAGTYTLEGSIEGTDKTATVDVVVESAVPEVESVSAINNNDLTATISGSVNSADKVTVSLDGENHVEADLDEEGNFTFTTDSLEPGDYTATVVAHQGEETVEETVDFTVGLEVNSVSASTLAVDEDTDEQFLGVGINGSNNNIDVETLVDSGYEVEFQSTNTDVLEDASTGELDEAELTAGESFEYKVVLTKDDVTVESDLTEVNIESYASSVTSVSDFDLLFNNDVVNESGVISVTDSSVSLDNFDVTYKNGDEAEIKGDNSQVDFSSSDESVALIDDNGNITPVSSGGVTFTIEAGDVEKTVTVTVSGEERTASSADLSKEMIGLVSSVEDTFELTVKDQFGDAVKGFDAQIADVQNKDEEDILAVTDAGNTDTEGKTTVTVKADAANEGTGTLDVENADGDVLGSIDVTVDADTEVAERKLELDSDSDDKTLDLNPLDSDNEVSLVLNEYNESGLKIGGYDFAAGDYTYESSDDDVITVGDNDEANGLLDVTAVSEGTAKVLVKEGSVVRHEVEVNVEDTTPSVSSASFQEGIEITSAGTLNLEEDILDNVGLSGEGTVAYEVSSGDVVAYIDVNEDDAYVEADDVNLGTIDVLSNDFDTAQFAPNGDDIELAKDYDSATITDFAVDDEGTVVVRLTAEGDTNAKAVRSINVDVE
ncbi:S-layer homology domain-containing protein [Thalassobacillus sp. CUG 92003]|uniref:S-layer homology domain-containing protein n=1 Tax=Thalassobacillus sp. CUG 92003 TaxID=2736641 RepID=UPI0015E770E9|nr:S-layer homology domain-containing protein [Thalassobacillus sp. CUG 92003]